MAATTLQPRTEPENLVMVLYPSIAADFPGQVIGRMMTLIPLPFVSHASLPASLLGLVLLPINLLLITFAALGGLGGYFMLKAFGERYVLTNRSMQIWSSIGARLIGEVPLAQVAGIEIEQHNGQEFFHAADLKVLDAGGHTALTLAGVPRPNVFRQTILEARDARNQVEAALTTIGSRAAR